MRFKLVGLMLLLAGAALVAYALFLENNLREEAFKPQTYCLAAIFLAITVRVLQAERHHRASRQRRASDVEPRHPERMPEPAHFEEDLVR